MTRLVAALVAAAALVSGCGGTKTQTVTTAGGKLGPTGEALFFAHIKSLSRSDGGFNARLDPAWFLTGLTAKRAKLEDTGDADVPNDYYIRDESHRLLTYRVPASAHATVLVGGLHPVSITVAELARIIAGRNPRHRQLYDRARGLGYWVDANGDTVRSLDQQYQP